MRTFVDGKNMLVCLALVALMSAVGTGNSSEPEVLRKPTVVEEGLSSNSTEFENVTVEGRSSRQGKNLLDWIGLGTDGDTDPYLAKVNAACFEGDLSECFKFRALSSLDDFFGRELYTLNENARVVRMPAAQIRQLHQEEFEYTSLPRAGEQEWDQFVKFLARKLERFVKSTAIEVRFPEEVTEKGRYSPRFLDEIASEIDLIEDKNESAFSRTRLKKLLIPLLVILKLFKLKLLLFLPLVLGLASFKKLLGLLALVVPGVIGFFRFCKPDLSQTYGSFGHSSFYQRPPHLHIQAGGHHNPYNREGGPPQQASYGNYPSYIREGDPSPLYGQHSPYVREEKVSKYPVYQAAASSSVAFRENTPQSASESSEDGHSNYDAQQLAYQGYQQYQNR